MVSESKFVVESEEIIRAFCPHCDFSNDVSLSTIKTAFWWNNHQELLSLEKEKVEYFHFFNCRQCKEKIGIKIKTRCTIEHHAFCPDDDMKRTISYSLPEGDYRDIEKKQMSNEWAELRIDKKFKIFLNPFDLKIYFFKNGVVLINLYKNDQDFAEAIFRECQPYLEKKEKDEVFIYCGEFEKKERLVRRFNELGIGYLTNTLEKK